jgi:hypothetical protein
MGTQTLNVFFCTDWLRQQSPTGTCGCLGDLHAAPEVTLGGAAAG